MNHALTHPDTRWQEELEQRAMDAVDVARVNRFLSRLPPPPEPMPSSQLLGLALCFGLLGAFLTVCLLVSFGAIH